MPRDKDALTKASDKGKPNRSQLVLDCGRRFGRWRHRSGRHPTSPIRHAGPAKLRRGVYRFLTIDITGHRARVETIAADDDDAIEQGQLYFESDLSLASLQVQTSSGVVIRGFVKATS